MNKYKIFIISVVIILTLAFTIISLFQQKTNIILILPYAYLGGLVFISAKNQNWTQSLVKILIMLLYGIRMVIYPCLCIINNNMDQLSKYSTLDQAVFLQIYEYFIITIFLMFIKPENIEKFESSIVKDKKKTSKLRKIMILLFILSIILIIIYPQILNVFRPLFFKSSKAEIEWSRSMANVKKTMPIVIYYLGVWLIKLIRIILVYYLIIYIKQLNVKRENNNNYIKILISILLACTPILITTDDRAGGFLSSVVLSLLIAKIYKEKRRQIITIAISAFIIIATVILIIMPTVKRKNNISENDYDQRINAYFSGTINIAAGLNMPTTDSYKYIKGDILRYIPLIVSFYTNYPQSNDLFNQVLGIDTVYNSQIMPTIIQGYFYFGYILSPIFSILLAAFALKTEENAKMCKDTFGYFIYTYMSIFFASGIIMYYFSLTIYLVLQYAFPMLCMYKIFKKQGEKL